MTSDEITNMAKEAGFFLLDGPADTEAILILLHRFATLVAAAERQACIDLVAFHGGSVEIEAAIRARGQA